MDDTVAPPPPAKPCSCGSDDFTAEALSPGQPGYGQHHGKFICCNCGRFNGWVPNPAVTDAAIKRATEIKNLLDRAVLTPWERQFLLSVSQQRHLTDKQQAILTKIQGRARD